MQCNVCLSSELENVISLPKYPLNSIYLTKAEKILNRFTPKDFSLFICQQCLHFQGISQVKLDDLYNDEYNYRTQNSGVQGRIAFFMSQLKNVEDIKFNRIIDVGCYDLSLLKVVMKKIKANYYIGIDPSIPSAVMNNSEEIICFKDYVDNIDIPFFDQSLPDLVLSDQTFEHIPTINTTLANISEKVSQESIFAVCVPSMEVLIEKLNFHNLIHEHVNYFSIYTLNRLFSLNNLCLRDYALNYTSTCGFLFGLFCKSKIADKYLPENNINKKTFLDKFGFFKTLLKYSAEIMNEIKDERIYGFGASDITANFAYMMESDLSFIYKIIDDTEYKQGKYLPNLHPEIISSNGLENLDAANCFITAPQAARYIYARINALNFKKIISPVGLIS